MKKMVTRAGNKRLLWLILLSAVLLRLLYAMPQATLSEYGRATGGDSGWYLALGAGFFLEQPHGTVHGIDYYNSVIPVPPMYILFVGFIQQFLPAHESILLIRLLQCLAGTATVYLAFCLAAALSRQQRAGLFAAALLAFHPAMIIEPANIATETLYMFFIAMGLWHYMQSLEAAEGGQAPYRLGAARRLILAALALGLASLTRAASLMFPLLLAGHLLWLGRRRQVRKPMQKCILLLAVYSAIICSWTVHNLVLWDRFVLVSDQLLPTIWRGVETEDGSPAQNDALLLAGGERDVAADCEVDCKYQHPVELYLRRIAEIVEEDLPGLLALRASELLYAILQPHGTTDFGDVSVMAAARDWLTGERSFASLLDILRIDGFALKLATWLFHYTALALGLLGIFWTRRQALRTVPVVGFALYTLAAHLILLALPRYLFPLEIVWAIFAGWALQIALQRRHQENSILVADVAGVVNSIDIRIQ